MSSSTRRCEQCGTSFTPRREHARFCSAACRIAWNSETIGEWAAEQNALTWSITAMEEAAERLSKVRATDSSKAFAVVGEAVWWVTIVDATMVRYHPDRYDLVLGTKAECERELTEQTLAGLRFVRNQMSLEDGRADFIGRGRGDGETDGELLTDWVWNSMPEPSDDAGQAVALSWKLARYEGYQVGLAGHTVGASFDRVVAFLKLATAASL